MSTVYEMREQVAHAEVAGSEPAGFGQEYRHLARQRRFERSTQSAPVRDEAIDAPAARAPRQSQASAIPTAASGRVRADRLSADAHTMLIELSRLADRTIEAREALLVERNRADRAERDLANANQRLMAARSLVHEAQATARAAVERGAFIEGRCEALQDALDLALNASLLQRWRWRRRAARRVE